MKSRFRSARKDNFGNLYAAHNQALVELAERNQSIVSCYADFPSGEVGEVFQKKFPDRIIDVGIAEGHLISSAAGLADAGFIPFTHCHAIFALGRGYNQIRHNLAYDNRNVKVVLCNSGVIWGGIGPSHLTVEDLAALRSIPNLVILSPSDSVTSKKATLAAADYVGPVILRLPPVGEAFPTLYTDDVPFEIGKSICLHDGNDITIIATGTLVNDAVEVSESLEREGIQVRVLDIQTIKPLDETAILEAARETGTIITVEDGTILGGLGGAVAELTAGTHPARVERIGVNDRFGDSGTSKEIKQHYNLTASHIESVVKQVLKEKKAKFLT